MSIIPKSKSEIISEILLILSRDSENISFLYYRSYNHYLVRCRISRGKYRTLAFLNIDKDGESAFVKMCWNDDNINNIITPRVISFVKSKGVHILKSEISCAIPPGFCIKNYPPPRDTRDNAVE